MLCKSLRLVPAFKCSTKQGQRRQHKLRNRLGSSMLILLFPLWVITDNRGDQLCLHPKNQHACLFVFSPWKHVQDEYYMRNEGWIQEETTPLRAPSKLFIKSNRQRSAVCTQQLRKPRVLWGALFSSGRLALICERGVFQFITALSC